MPTGTNAESHEPSQQRRWSSANSHKVIKAYDRSPLSSPPLSRNNSVTSIRSEPGTRSYDDRRDSKKDTNSSTQIANTARRSSLVGFFSRDKKPKEKKDMDKIVLTSRHAAAIKTKMMLDPTYKELQHKHPGSKTAGIEQHTRSSHSTAAEQEARHPHSGPPAIHPHDNTLMLARIESRDEPDEEIDQWEKRRRDWNDAKDHNMSEITEARSRNNSTTASRETSPDRLGARKKSSWAGVYHRNEEGRWTRNYIPSAAHPRHSVPSHSDTLAANLTERLKAL